MFKKVVLVLGIVVAALLTVIATRPENFKVERSSIVAAPPGVAFAEVSDFHNWSKWSPWEHLDANMKKVYEGAPSGTGAVYSWTGNDKVGEGRMTITDVTPGERVVIKLEFIKPFEATNTTTFTFRPQAATGTTEINWTMEGKNTFLGKAMSLFMNMDSMVGKDFENGLAMLKTASETDAKIRAEEEAQQARAAAEKAAAEKAAAEAAAAAAPAEPAPAGEAPAAGVAH